MNPILAATLRRHWPLAGATVLFVIFMIAHQAVFQPAVARYEAALKRSRELGLAIDPSRIDPVLPPRVYARVMDNAMPAAAAAEQAGSGVLAARLLEELAQIATADRLDVRASEPGPVSQQESSTIVRAHLTLRGDYASFVAFLDGLARGPRLITVDRFSMMPDGGALTIEVWASRLVLKRDGARR
jgi:hypothetical protein